MKMEQYIFDKRNNSNNSIDDYIAQIKKHRHQEVENEFEILARKLKKQEKEEKTKYSIQNPLDIMENVGAFFPHDYY